MFRKLFGFGLLVLLLAGLFGGFGGRRTQSAYYEGYAAGLQAQSGAETAEGSEASPPPAAYHDGYGHGRFIGWGILGIFAVFFKIGFFFLLAMLFMRLIFGRRRWRHRGGPWAHHPMHWRGHHDRPGKEKSPQWMADSDDDEPVMTV